MKESKSKITSKFLILFKITVTCKPICNFNWNLNNLLQVQQIPHARNWILL